MNIKYITFLITLLMSLSAQAQELPSNLHECSQVLAQVEQSLNDITADRINILLASTNKLCLGNVEFSEWVNELIYSVAHVKPNEFIRSFSNQSSEVQINIIKELESPIHDGIDVEGTYNAINRAKEHKVKSRLLSAIKVAANKVGLKY